MILNYDIYQKYGILPKFDNKFFYLYELCDPTTMEVRYIGKTKNIKKRVEGHLSPSNLKPNTHKNNWIKCLLSEGKEPLTRIILAHIDINKISELEVEKIKLYRSAGYRLTNLTDGGDGQSHMLEETRLKISNSKKGKSSGPISEAVKLKISAANKGKKHGPMSLERKLKTCKKIVGTCVITGVETIFISAIEAARILGLKSTAGIAACCRNRPSYHTSGGYRWRYAC